MQLLNESSFLLISFVEAEWEGHKWWFTRPQEASTVVSACQLPGAQILITCPWSCGNDCQWVVSCCFECCCNFEHWVVSREQPVFIWFSFSLLLLLLFLHSLQRSFSSSSTLKCLEFISKDSPASAGFKCWFELCLLWIFNGPNVLYTAINNQRSVDNSVS